MPVGLFPFLTGSVHDVSSLRFPPFFHIHELSGGGEEQNLSSAPLSTAFLRGLTPRGSGIFGIWGLLANRIQGAVLQLRSPREKCHQKNTGTQERLC